MSKNKHRTVNHFEVIKRICTIIFLRMYSNIKNVCVKFQCSTIISFSLNIKTFFENTKTHTDRQQEFQKNIGTELLAHKGVPYLEDSYQTSYT